MKAKSLKIIFQMVCVTGLEQEGYEFYIYDRWGTEIFNTTSPLQGWDGRANSGTDIAQQDVYVWKLILTDVFEKKTQL